VIFDGDRLIFRGVVAGVRVLGRAATGAEAVGEAQQAGRAAVLAIPQHLVGAGVVDARAVRFRAGQRAFLDGLAALLEAAQQVAAPGPGLLLLSAGGLLHSVEGLQQVGGSGMVDGLEDGPRLREVPGGDKLLHAL